MMKGARTLLRYTQGLKLVTIEMFIMKLSAVICGFTGEKQLLVLQNLCF